MRSPISAVLTGASASMNRPGRIPASRQSAASKAHGGEREAVGLRGGFGRARARPAEKRHAIGLDEAGGGERRREREQRAYRRHQEFKSP